MLPMAERVKRKSASDVEPLPDVKKTRQSHDLNPRISSRHSSAPHLASAEGSRTADKLTMASTAQVALPLHTRPIFGTKMSVLDKLKTSISLNVPVAQHGAQYVSPLPASPQEIHPGPAREGVPTIAELQKMVGRALHIDPNLDVASVTRTARKQTKGSGELDKGDRAKCLEDQPSIDGADESNNEDFFIADFSPYLLVKPFFFPYFADQ